jgi:hypothetical protein
LRTFRARPISRLTKINRRSIALKSKHAVECRKLDAHRLTALRFANESSATRRRAASMLKEAKYIWNDEHRGYMRARRKGRSPANDRRNEPDVISEEGLSDHGLIYPDALPKERRAALDWLAERIRQGG